MIERRLRTVVVSGFGSKVSRKNELMKISTAEGEEIQVSPREVEQVIIAGEASVTSGLVRLLLENDVDLVFVEHRPSNFFARVVRSDYNMITELWRKQIILEARRRFELAREIMDCAIYNKVRMLQGIAKNREIDFESEISHLNGKRARLAAIKDNETLMGVEGDAARTYFGALRKIIPKEFGFTKREKHPPRDPVNSLLSYGYTVLKSRVEFGLMRAGLNPYEGVLHVAYRNRPALSFDLMEEFRQPIVDRVVLTQIAQRRMSVVDFEQKEEMCYLCEGLKRQFLEALYNRFDDVYMHHGERLPFLDIIFEQAKALAGAIRTEGRYEGFRYR